MKKYKKEIVILLLQLIIFYLFPLTCGPTDAIAMVILILFSAFLLSFILGCISKEKVKLAYPFAIALLFIPSIPIYYNWSASIHIVWHMTAAIIGLSLGILIRWIGFKFLSVIK